MKNTLQLDGQLAICKLPNIITGPGAYNPASTQSYLKGTLASQTPRFVEKPNNVPGPGHYRERY